MGRNVGALTLTARFHVGEEARVVLLVAVKVGVRDGGQDGVVGSGTS